MDKFMDKLESIHETPICASNMSKILNYCDKEKLNCVFEIGAYDGVDISEIKSLFGEDCHIHAFEPDFESFSILEKYYNSDTVFCNKIALSNFVGSTKFVKCYDPNINEDNQNSRDLWFKTNQSLRHNNMEVLNQVRPGSLGNMIEKEYDVDVVTINEYCKINNVKPDILLMDTQGSEYEVLEGASDILDNVKVISTEWSSIQLYENQKLLSDIQNLLSKYGFELVEKINLWYDIHGDAIFCKKQL